MSHSYAQKYDGYKKVRIVLIFQEQDWPKDYGETMWLEVAGRVFSVELCIFPFIYYILVYAYIFHRQYIHIYVKRIVYIYFYCVQLL